MSADATRSVKLFILALGANCGTAFSVIILITSFATEEESHFTTLEKSYAMKIPAITTKTIPIRIPIFLKSADGA